MYADQPVREVELEVLRMFLDLFPVGLVVSVARLPTDPLSETRALIPVGI